MSRIFQKYFRNISIIFQKLFYNSILTLLFYKINDLLKMNLSIYAIKVGTTTLSQLDVNKELDIDFYSRPKDNPDYTSSEKKTSDDTDKNRKLDVYDVLLAGVETNG